MYQIRKQGVGKKSYKKINKMKLFVLNTREEIEQFKKGENNYGAIIFKR